MPDEKLNQFSHFSEGGFTLIPNELLEALIVTKINGTQLRVCLHLVRNTYGWRRESVAVSLNDFADACGSITQWISKQIKELVDTNIIIRSENKTGKKAVYKINNNFSEWESTPEEEGEKVKKPSCDHMIDASSGSCESMIVDSCNHMIVDSCESMIDVSCDSMTQQSIWSLEPPESQQSLNKDLKENLKKDKESPKFTEDSICYSLAKLMLDKIQQRLPSFKKPDLQKWSASMDKLIRLDKRDPEEVKRVIIFAQSDPFWQINMLSVDNLRNKYDYINSKRLARAGKSRLCSREAGDKDKYDFFFKD